MTDKEEELNSMLRKQQINELSSEQQLQRQEAVSRSQYRKPIRDPFSDHSDSNSDIQPANHSVINTPFPPRPKPQKSVLQQVQEQMKWDRNQQIETEILMKLEGQGMKDKKIKELASKYRSLNIAYQKERTMRKNLQNQLNQIIKTGEGLNRSGVSQERGSDKIPRKSLQKSQKFVNNTEKCSLCSENQKKVMEFRLKSQNSKTQLNKVMRLLTRQLGQNFDIDKALSQQNSWKGRQQKIQKLKARVKDLEQKLNNNGINVSHMSGFTQVTNANRTNAAFQSTRTSAMLADNKRKELENLKVQVDALKSENQLLHGKVKSLTSRKLILENQMKELKGDFEKKRQLFIQKSENDDKFIALLKNQNQKLKRQQKVVTKVIYKDEGSDLLTLKKENQALKKKVRALTINSQKQIKQQAQPVIDTTSQVPTKSKDLNSRVLSAQKKKQLQNQYLNSTKYLKKMTNQDEQQLYKNWKNSVNKNI